MLSKIAVDYEVNVEEEAVAKCDALWPEVIDMDDGPLATIGPLGIGSLKCLHSEILKTTNFILTALVVTFHLMAQGR